MLATIGHRNAVAIIYGVKLSGFLAWFLWRGIYLAKLPTLSRKLEVALSWACSIPFPPNIVQLRLSPNQSRLTTQKNS
jgi:NADH dehydrogenase